MNDGRFAIFAVTNDLAPTQAQAYRDWLAKL